MWSTIHLNDFGAKDISGNVGISIKKVPTTAGNDIIGQNRANFKRLKKAIF